MLRSIGLTVQELDEHISKMVYFIPDDSANPL